MDLSADGFSVASLARDARASQAVSKRPVDLVHLARYTLGNRALEREVLELFLTQSQIYLERLRESAEDRAWRDAAHTIKGSARGIGAWGVASVAEAAEALQGEALAADRAPMIEALEQQVEEASVFIRTLLADA